MTEKDLIATLRSAIEAAQEVIGQCDCIMEENPEKDPKLRWYTARDHALADWRTWYAEGHPK